MRHTPLVLLVACALPQAAPAAAQLAVELRAGGAIGNHEASAAGLETALGPSWGAALEYRLHPVASLYGAYTRATFGCEEGFCAPEGVRFTSSGVSAGARLHLPRLPWLRAGLLYHGVDADAGERAGTVDPGIGYEAAAGLTLPLTPRFAVLPALVYRHHAGTDAVSKPSTSMLGAELSVRLRLGR